MLPQQSVSAQSRRSFDTFSAWALVITFVASLFVILPSSSVLAVTTKTYVLAAGALITLALFILARLTRGNLIFPPYTLVAALWLPVLAYALSSIFSGIPFLSALWGTSLEQDTLGFMLIVAGLGTLGALILRRKEQYQSFLRTGGIAFGVAVLIQALVLLVGQYAPNTVSPSFSLVGSAADLAAFLGLGVISMLISLRFLELKGTTKRVFGVLVVLALFLLAITNSSLVWTLVALASLGLFVESIMRRSMKSSDLDLDDTLSLDEAPIEDRGGNRPIALPLITLAASLFFLLGGTLGGALASALHVNVLNVRPSWESTFTVIQKVYSTAPVFGSGPNTFGVEWLKYRDASLNSTVFWNIDFSSGIGFIPTSFATTGIAGAIAWIVFLGLFLALGLRTLVRRTPSDAFVRYVSVLSFIGTVYLFVIAIFDLPNPFILASAFLLAGLFISTTRFAEGSGQWGIAFSRSPRLGFVIVFALTLLLLSSVAAAYSLVEHYIATNSLGAATTALNAGDLDKADRQAQNATVFAPSAAVYQLQSVIAGARLNAITTSTTLDRTTAQKEYQAALSSGINAALTATNLEPSNYQNWLALGNLYAQAVPLKVTGAYESAKKAYSTAQTLSPTNPQIPYVIAQLDIANRDTKAAQEDLKAAITLKQDYTAAIFLLSQLLVQDSNVKDALAAALAAQYFTPNNPNILFQVGVLYAAQNDLPNAAAALSAAVSANPQFANARYLLSAIYAKQGDMQNALAEMQTIAAMSSDNAKAVSAELSALEAKKDPFPANLLSASSTPVK
jgi:cytochrome c-type biogenesis protein CcmH/NrfG